MHDKNPLLAKNLGNKHNNAGTSVKWTVNVMQIEQKADNPREMTISTGKKQSETKHNPNNPPDVKMILPA